MIKLAHNLVHHIIWASLTYWLKTLDAKLHHGSHLFSCTLYIACHITTQHGHMLSMGQTPCTTGLHVSSSTKKSKY